MYILNACSVFTATFLKYTNLKPILSVPILFIFTTLFINLPVWFYVKYNLIVLVIPNSQRHQYHSYYQPNNCM